MLRILLFIILYFSCLLPIWELGLINSADLSMLNSVIALICCIAFFLYPSKPYSLYKIFHVFILFFFCIAPSIQYKNNIHFFGTYFSEDSYLQASFLVLLILLVYNIVYITTFAKAKIKERHLTHVELLREEKPIGRWRGLCMLGVSLFTFLLVFYTNGFNFASMLFRGGDFSEERIELERSAGLIVGNFLKPMSMVILLAAYIAGVRQKAFFAILLILFLLTCPVTGMARFSVAAMYIPVCLNMIPLFRRKDVFVLILCFSLLVVFPFLDNFRYYSAGQELEFGLNFDQFTELHFDSYSMFMRVLSENIITWGHQLLGVLFFWVPRSLWPTKPIGSGAFLAHEKGWYFTNVSMPFFGEGYINFGLLGVFVFAVLLSVVSAVEDKRYWSVLVKREHDLRKIRYFILLAMLMFILRGDLLSSIAFTCGYIASYYIIKRLVLRR